MKLIQETLESIDIVSETVNYLLATEADHLVVSHDFLLTDITAKHNTLKA